MITLPVYLILTPICLVMFWLGFVLLWRMGNKPVVDGDIKWLALFTLVCFIPLVQVAVPIAMWICFIGERLQDIDFSVKTEKTLQRIANRLDSLVHYRKVK